MKSLYDKVSEYKNLLRGWNRVKENYGCPGVDRMTIEGFDNKLDRNLISLQKDLRSERYKPLPLLKFLVDKGNGEARSLSVPTVRDRVAHSAVLRAVEPIFEAEFEEISFAYRKGRSVKQAIYEVKECRDKGYKWVVDADIDAFFDNVNHDLLFERIETILKNTNLIRLIKMWVRAEVYDGNSVFRLKEGIPQGSAISPILANLFLDHLDEELMRKKYKMVRFADDFLVLCKEKEEAQEALEITDEILEKMFLELDEKKTSIINFDQGFRYLGVIFLKSMIMVPFEREKKKKNVLYMPPPLNLSAYFRNRDRRKNYG